MEQSLREQVPADHWQRKFCVWTFYVLRGVNIKKITICLKISLETCDKLYPFFSSKPNQFSNECSYTFDCFLSFVMLFSIITHLFTIVLSTNCRHSSYLMTKSIYQSSYSMSKLIFPIFRFECLVFLANTEKKKNNISLYFFDVTNLAFDFHLFVMFTAVTNEIYAWKENIKRQTKRNICIHSKTLRFRCANPSVYESVFLFDSLWRNCMIKRKFDI